MLPIKKGAEILSETEKALLIVHQDPDGDSIASSLALFLGLQQLGKQATLVCKDPIPANFLFLPAVSSFQNDFILSDFEVAVILDSGDLRRTGFANRLKENQEVLKYIINIDHHPKNDLHKIASLNIVDYNAPATSVILAKFIRELGVNINADIATCLLCGIFTDTGGFRHTNTTLEVLELSSSLMSQGADLQGIVSHIANSRTIEALKLWGVALSRMRKNKWGLVSSIVSQADLKLCKAQPEDLAGIVNLINSVPESKVAVVFSEIEPGMIKASFRTEDKNYDVARLAKMFGGGGHSKAAGFTSPGKIVKNKEGLRVILKSGPYREKDPLDILDRLLI